MTEHTFINFKDAGEFAKTLAKVTGKPVPVIKMGDVFLVEDVSGIKEEIGIDSQLNYSSIALNIKSLIDNANDLNELIKSLKDEFSVFDFIEIDEIATDDSTKEFLKSVPNQIDAYVELSDFLELDRNKKINSKEYALESCYVLKDLSQSLKGKFADQARFLSKKLLTDSASLPEEQDASEKARLSSVIAKLEASSGICTKPNCGGKWVLRLGESGYFWG